MARTAQLDLPLVAPSQAQKHVTVNEALARLDAVAQLEGGLLFGAGAARGLRATGRATSCRKAHRCMGREGGPDRGVEQWWLGLPGAQGRLAGMGREPGPASPVRRHGLDHGCAGGIARGRCYLLAGRRVRPRDRAWGGELRPRSIPVQAQVLGVTGRVVSSSDGAGADRLEDRGRRCGRPVRNRHRLGR